MSDETMQPEIPNGAAAAAILSAGAGCFILSALAWLGDFIPALSKFFNFYNPSGPLSGVTTVAILLWLILWFILGKAWGGKSVSMAPVNVIAFLLLIVGLLVTFPPISDLLQGK